MYSANSFGKMLLCRRLRSLPHPPFLIRLSKFYIQLSAFSPPSVPWSSHQPTINQSIKSISASVFEISQRPTPPPPGTLFTFSITQPHACAIPSHLIVAVSIHSSIDIVLDVSLIPPLIQCPAYQPACNSWPSLPAFSLPSSYFFLAHRQPKVVTLCPSHLAAMQ